MVYQSIYILHTRVYQNVSGQVTIVVQEMIAQVSIRSLRDFHSWYGNVPRDISVLTCHRVIHVSKCVFFN